MIENAAKARLSRELVTIRRDVPVTLDLDRLRVRPPDVARLTELFIELEFKSLVPRLEAFAGAAVVAADSIRIAAKLASR